MAPACGQFLLDETLVAELPGSIDHKGIGDFAFSGLTNIDTGYSILSISILVSGYRYWFIPRDSILGRSSEYMQHYV